MKGRYPKPTEDLKLHGKYKPSKHGHRLSDEDDVQGEPEMPDWIASDAEACWHWEMVINSYRSGLLRYGDTAILAMASRWWAEWRRLDALSVLIQPPDPAIVKVADTAAGRWQRCAALLGLSPVDRARLRQESAPAAPVISSRVRA
jgi:phage terminase small subunit